MISCEARSTCRDFRQKKTDQNIPPPKIKGPGPSIMANHIGSKFGPILLGKKQNLHEAAPLEGAF
jgi:hypothetical protein